jgi:protoporphyrinogen oxidase
MQGKKVCIIGAGIGGLTAGALLSNRGYRVQIFEKEPFLGGRALSLDGSSLTYQEYKDILSRFRMSVAFSEPDLSTIFEKKMLKGYKIDLGYHAIGGGAFSNLYSVLSELKEHIEIVESYVGFIKDQGYDFPFLSRKDKLKILPKILRLLFSGEKTMRKLDPIPMTETIEKYGKGKMKLILEVFSRSITTVNNLDVISTGETFRAQKNLYKGSKPVGYPINGLGSIHKKLSALIKKNNGSINLRKPVEKILIDGKKAIGVEVEGKKHFFDIIISNVLIHELFDIVEEKYFPKEYVEGIKSLKGTGSLTAYYSLKKIDPYLLGKTFHFLERDAGIYGKDAVGMIDFMSAIAGVAPPSRYLVQSYIICSPEEARNPNKLEILKELLDRNLEKLIPNYHSYLDWAIYPAVWHLDGVAKTIDNVKPDIRTPIENLYMVGDCVKAPGIGINCAINSARILRDIID